MKGFLIEWSKTKQELIRSPFFPARGWSEGENAHGVRSQAQLWRMGAKAAFSFLVFLQPQRPKDTGTGRERERAERAHSSTARDRAWTRTWTKRRSQGRKSPQLPARAVPGGVLLVPSQVLPKLEGLAWLDGTTNLTKRCQICTHFM